MVLMAVAIVGTLTSCCSPRGMWNIEPCLARQDSSAADQDALMDALGAYLTRSSTCWRHLERYNQVSPCCARLSKSLEESSDRYIPRGVAVRLDGDHDILTQRFGLDCDEVLDVDVAACRIDLRYPAAIGKNDLRDHHTKTARDVEGGSASYDVKISYERSLCVPEAVISFTLVASPESENLTGPSANANAIYRSRRMLYLRKTSGWRIISERRDRAARSE